MLQVGREEVHRAWAEGRTVEPRLPAGEDTAKGDEGDTERQHSYEHYSKFNVTIMF